MRSDTDIKRDVEDELKWDPDLDAADIAVSVSKGVVTLAGFVKTYLHKFEAEKVAKRVAGVLGVANDLEVRLPSSDERPDPEIARDIVAAIKSRLPIAADRLKPIVKNGWVTLEGEVEWNYQREAAEEAARRVKGVRGVTNSIKIKPQASAEDIKRKIEEALRRNAEIDASRIEVETSGDGVVVLKGRVRSWIERDEAERAAWSAPGVVKVDDRIVVSP
jgi:osmotically-inducible protein OsmY